MVNEKNVKEKKFVKRIKSEQGQSWRDACLKCNIDPSDAVYYLPEELEEDGYDEWVGVYSLNGTKIGTHKCGWSLRYFEEVDELASMVLEASVKDG